MALHFEAVSPASLPANILAAPVRGAGHVARDAADRRRAVAPGARGAQRARGSAARVPGVESPTSPPAPGRASPSPPGARAARRLHRARRGRLAALGGRRPRRGRWPRGGRGALAAWPPRRRALAARGAPPAAPGALVVSFLDVGQGDATLLQHGGAISSTPARPAADPGGCGVRARGASTRSSSPTRRPTTRADAEAIIRATGPAAGRRRGRHADGGAPRIVPAAPHARRPRARAERRPGAERPAGWTCGCCGRAPSPTGVPRGATPTAARSSARVGAFDLLLPADAESDATAPLAFPDVEVLKVAHHGSEDPGLPASCAGPRRRSRSWRSASTTPTATRPRRRCARPPSPHRSCAPTATGPCGCVEGGRMRVQAGV